MNLDRHTIKRIVSNSASPYKQSDAFLEGLVDYYNDKSLENCPYLESLSISYECWQAGFDAARQHDSRYTIG